MFGDRGETAINSFLNTARPIRVWYNGIIVAAAGNPLQERTLNAGQSVASSSTYYLTNNRAELSRLTWGTAPTVLHLFSRSGVAPSDGMSSWEQAFLQSLYNTSQEQRSQLSAIKTLMIRNMSP
jgi:hypothetical protein